MKVTIVGTGYVGLTTGIVLAYLKNSVVCIDIDESKIDKLKNGIMPIYEPYLAELYQLARENLTFTSDYAEAVRDAEVILLAVGTPPMADGTPDLTYIEQAACDIGRHLGEGPVIIVNKSTVPVGSGNWVRELIQDSLEENNGPSSGGAFTVTSNPEFLKEGTAVYDSLYPDRIVIGADDTAATQWLIEMYRPIIEQSFEAPGFLQRPGGFGRVPLVITDLVSAELIKYASNAFLSLKISFINEIGSIAEMVGADITQIAEGIGSDRRIGPGFLKAGIGWGGSCFAKDTAALLSIAGEYGLSMPIVEAARNVNYRLRKKVAEKVLGQLKVLKGKSIGILGLAFKPGTDDLRDAPAIDIAKEFISRGAKVFAHDPVAAGKAKNEFCDLGIQYEDAPEGVFQGASAVVLVTEWPQYRDLDWEKMAGCMRTPFIFDGRNFLDRDRLQEIGFSYLGVGR